MIEYTAIAVYAFSLVGFASGDAAAAQIDTAAGEHIYTAAIAFGIGAFGETRGFAAGNCGAAGHGKCAVYTYGNTAAVDGAATFDAAGIHFKFDQIRI